MFHTKRPLSPALAAVALVPVLAGVDGLITYYVHLRNTPPHVAEASRTYVTPSVETFPRVTHTWRTAVMARRIHRGMTQAQVTRILGRPYQHEGPICAMPGDVPMQIQFRETYCGRDGPLYVCYRDASVPPYIVAADISTERKDLGPFFL